MSRTPPFATDPATAAYEYTFQFEPRGGGPTESITVIRTSPDSTAAKEQAYHRLGLQLGISDATRHYRVERSVISFHDEPWNSFDDLETSLGDLDNVTHAIYLSPICHSHGPTTFRLTTETGKESDVCDAVTEYYPGLISRVESDGVVYVIASPVEAAW